jgi:hypothetical protein
VVREAEVLAARVDIDDLAEDVASHGRALNVPTRPALWQRSGGWRNQLGRRGD